MDQRRNSNQYNRFRGVQVPQRTQPTLSPKKAVIPLLDEKKHPLPSGPIRFIHGIGRIFVKHPKRNIVILILLLAIGYVAMTQLSKKVVTPNTESTQINPPSEGALERNAKPAFPTVVPADKSIEELGGWTRISPKDRAPVYAYADKLNDVAIRVSQQELPANLAADDERAAEGIQKLAADFKADQKLTIGNTTAFIGTSAKGPQSVIFAKNKLLILITSDQKIDNDHWSAYISSLR